MNVKWLNNVRSLTKPCTQCGKTPQHYYHRCKECFTIWNRKDKARKDARRRARIAQLPIHTRVCVGCRQPFLSQRGFNLCLTCADRVCGEAAAKTFNKRTIKQLTATHVRTVLANRFTWRVSATPTPRIPLSEIGVFEAVPR